MRKKQIVTSNLGKKCENDMQLGIKKYTQQIKRAVNETTYLLISKPPVSQLLHGMMTVLCKLL